MRLNELLKTAYDIEYEIHDVEFYATFKTEDDQDFKFSSVSLGPFRTWETDFSLRTKGGDIRWDITNKGDAFKIFATIIKILDNFLVKEKPKSFYFTAKEPSRRKLYQTMMVRFLKNHPEYKQITNKDDKELVYIERTNKDVFLVRKD